MKKTVVFLFASFFTLLSFAQQRDGNFGIEINFTPFSLADEVFSVDGLKVRYFMSDDVVIRGTIDFSLAPEKTVDYNADGKEISTSKSNTTTFGLTPGFEYHVAKFGKGSVYVGAEVGFLLSKSSASVNFVENSDANTKVKGGGFGFGLGAFTGIDFYVTKNLYLGAELGLNYISFKNSPTNTTIGTVTVEDKDYTKESSFGFECVPAIRLGWTF